MMTVARSFRAPRHPIGLLVALLAAFAAAAGCSTSKSTNGDQAIVNHILPSGFSAPGWLVVPSGGSHASSATLDYIGSGGKSGCMQCHGSDLAGGISGVSCFGNSAGCHHGPVRPWSAIPPAPQPHGATAKKAPGNSGFASCQICHGADFSGGGAGVPCFPCHTVNAPHPPRPWRGSPYTHTDTNTANAPVCARCHFPGSPNNPAAHPATPAPAGTAPGCFNSTLCHGAAGAPHPLGNPAWYATPPAAQVHGSGPSGAKATPSATAGFAYCQACHGSGADFAGGSSGVSCYACHGANAPHPRNWLPGDNYVHISTATGNASVCAFCHRNANPGTPGCFNNTLCHGGGGAPHAVPFLGTAHTAVAQAGFDQNCSGCHAVSGTSPLSGAPACATCHQAGSPLSALSCTSCHARPPAGTAYPNVAGKHAKHDALVSFTGVCGTCHNGLETGSAAHYARANARPGKDALRVEPGDTAFRTVVNARAGAVQFDNAALTCANVSCHGAVTAPSWRTGTIAVNTDAGCRQCHKLGTAAQTPENNSPYSGLHTFHLSTTVGGAILCTECHDMANPTTGATNHFRFLNTPQMEGPAGDTVEPNGSAANYTAATQTCGNFTCHTVTHSGFSWSGGPNHPVPFTGTSHTSVTSATFPGSCGACHFESGSATRIGPTCTVCHKAGSPLSNLNCTSCHASPPSGTAYANVAGKHAVHGTLPGVAGVCAPCHNGLESGSLAHYNRANGRVTSGWVPPGDVAFLTTYNAKSGAASFSAAGRTCSNVICHGGQTTPDWQTSAGNAIDVPNACLSCHASGTAQYNSYNSGEHSRHTSEFGTSATTCKLCHDAAKVNVTGHFQNLATQAFEQAPRDTVRLDVQYNGTSCNPAAGGRTGCHGQETW